MHRAIATVAVFKLLIFLVTFFTTTNLDPILLVNFILMSISAIIVRSVQEGEVALVLIALILLIDAIGLFLSFITLSFTIILAYVFLLIWDIQILLLLRQMI
ncbi:conserved hypothetical protein [Pyrobaculum islandicum DSM 4184]|uniref:Uncharacterized protein n=1 Tax=Pyrobaculum islandicum (strain DSM 4184 / JCM 9189 / GEO3) TaxID=384616 RepID=A1RV34_PYRIL|nr:hypothetical protein [Pyrobaculum islandicum]ABL88816.1 conserved hypothetical protein [Pyrobaculum islandicum DSM 4184]